MDSCPHPSSLPLMGSPSQQRPTSTGSLRALGSPGVTHVFRAGHWLLYFLGVVTFNLGFVDLLHVPKVNGTEEYA